MYVAITPDPIDPAAVLARVGNAGDGAAVLFVGRIRDRNDGRPVAGLAYDAYAPMAEKVLRELARETLDRLGLPPGGARIAVVHRVGELDVGDVGVAVAVASPHRAEAFDACRRIMDELKRRAPIWKRERYADGASEWLEGTVPEAAEPAHE